VARARAGLLLAEEAVHPAVEGLEAGATALDHREHPLLVVRDRAARLLHVEALEERQRAQPRPEAVVARGRRLGGHAGADPHALDGVDGRGGEGDDLDARRGGGRVRALHHLEEAGDLE
jgi:hypothetical protein